ncbi:MAG: hypothetical protein R3B70_31755 [Polyangiaceae bacterium]
MSPLPYPAPVACTEPTLGAQATHALGQALSERLSRHVASCRACQLQRRAFNELDRHAVTITPELLSRVRDHVLGGKTGHRAC